MTQNEPSKPQRLQVKPRYEVIRGYLKFGRRGVSPSQFIPDDQAHLWAVYDKEADEVIDLRPSKEQAEEKAKALNGGGD